jgi:hypothetical protein
LGDSICMCKLTWCIHSPHTFMCMQSCPVLCVGIPFNQIPSCLPTFKEWQYRIQEPWWSCTYYLHASAVNAQEEWT